MTSAFWRRCALRARSASWCSFLSRVCRSSRSIAAALAAALASAAARTIPATSLFFWFLAASAAAPAHLGLPLGSQRVVAAEGRGV